MNLINRCLFILSSLLSCKYDLKSIMNQYVTGFIKRSAKFIGLLFFLISVQISISAQAIKVEIVSKGNGYQLMRGGEPYFIKGAGGGGHLDILVKMGGNSIRTWSFSKERLDQAQKHSITVLMGHRMGKPRQGFDYRDQKSVAEMTDRIIRETMLGKDHPALLMWALGNEIELLASPEQTILAWKTMNKLAKMIKEIDGNHPVITVLSGVGDSRLEDIEKYCPELDAIGINGYGSMLRLKPRILEQKYPKPYLICEFGPRGHWESPMTPWGAVIEQNTSEKMQHYLQAYQSSIAGESICLGSYVFLWGQKQEKTHTWYGMFLGDGSATATVDAISKAWTGKWPKNRAPLIGPEGIVITAKDETVQSHWNAFSPGAIVNCQVETWDPEGAPITVKWDLRKDVSDAPGVGGDREPPNSPIEECILSSEGKQAIIRLPEEPKHYRIFMYVYDNSGRSATANVPVLVHDSDVDAINKL